MNQLHLVFRKYKEHFYLAEVDKPRGFQISIVLMAVFLFTAVGIGFTSLHKALFVYAALCFFLAIFPYLFPRDNP